MTGFAEYIGDTIPSSGCSTEECLSLFLPLLRQVIETHEADLVAPLEGTDDLHVTERQLRYDTDRSREALNNVQAVQRVLATADTNTFVENESICDVLDDDAEPHAVISAGFVHGYRSWEHLLNHHDPLTDVFSLGLILATLACGLDMHDTEDLLSFVRNRRNLFRIKPDLHPVIARTIVVMTEPDRRLRPPDLRALLVTLENYRDLDVDFETDLASTQSGAQDAGSMQQMVLAKLRERLFEINRRNRLLQFRTTQQTLNLTQSSVPIVSDVQLIRPDQILTWNGRFRDLVVNQQAVPLNSFLNLHEAVYVPGTLERIRREARRDENDLGFSQLRLVVALLRWADVKQQPAEMYTSPLFLVPVRLTIRKGLRDRYFLQATTSVAEVNPVVRHQFSQLYGVRLPETVDLADGEELKFADDLSRTISAGDFPISVRTIASPRLNMLRRSAERRLQQFRRRSRASGRNTSDFMGIQYSYDPVNFQPAGIQLFDQLIRPPTSEFKTDDTGATAEASRKSHNVVTTAADSSLPQEYSSADQSAKQPALSNNVDDNPFNWELDFCAIMLTNLRYRRMSLAEDYNRLISDDVSNEAFSAAFGISQEDKQPPAESDSAESDERFHILPCDPTQSQVILSAQTGASFIIQGPPGTGKSQTIANLLADYAVRGKRVLFVCEKRAAIDVVYHRLKQRDLHDLCCLIHDTQADKKQFVMDLKSTWDAFVSERRKRRNHELNRRNALAEKMAALLTHFEKFDSVMTTATEETGINVRELLNRLLRWRDRVPTLAPDEWKHVPHYSEFAAASRSLEDFQSRLQKFQPDGIMAHHAIRLLRVETTELERPVELIEKLLTGLQKVISDTEPVVEHLRLPSEVTANLLVLTQAADWATDAEFLAERDLLQLLDAESTLARNFQRQLRSLEKCDAAIDAAAEKNKGWIRKLSSDDTRAALALSREFEGKFFSFLRPAWWRLRRILKSSYEFSEHAVVPSWGQVLEHLDAEHERRAERYEVARRFGDEFNIHLDLDRFLENLKQLRSGIKTRPAAVRNLIPLVLRQDDGNAVVRKLAGLSALLAELHTTAKRILDAYEYCSLAELNGLTQQLLNSTSELPEYLYCLTALRGIEREVVRALRMLPVDTSTLAAAAAEKSLRAVCRDNPDADRFTDQVRGEQIAELGSLTERLLNANASAVRAFVRQRFCDNLRLSEASSAGLTDEQASLRQAWSAGRKELEHEFGKSMRYKSIRDLAAGDSGTVIRDLKPVWLMSPLSVSDTLPLDSQFFDVIIFDEASQITLEDAVPALFRANQAIVVGDEMQLPPTTFFSSRHTDDDLEIEDEGEIVHFDLNSSSLLNHASRHLTSGLLGWHYRSRSESLISFSNHAFYGGRLLTVPEEELAGTQLPELIVDNKSDADEFAFELLRRPVSFHFLPAGVYENRRNSAEAEYIACLVRQLLTTDRNESIGIVAFSEAQQSEIENALQRLTLIDADFAERYEAELEREDSGQFNGLLVRNLENIQGDERDVIILSVCYGPAPDGRMRMHFGPINMAGGEKRLNVAFSRAKQNMAIVASIRSDAITNDYNDGANCLKKYLRYAEYCSAGKSENAKAVLSSLSGRDVFAADEVEAQEPLAVDISNTLRARGYVVDMDIGQSHFKVDLAVRKEGDSKYRLGILTDTADWYEQTDIAERELLRPQLLRDFGWRVQVVLAMDWYRNRESCLLALEDVLSQPPECPATTGD